MDRTQQQEILRSLFGDNRAEWPPEKFETLFVAPRYFSRLEAQRPCFLVGGRGTGKTTVLQSLRYDAIARRAPASRQEVPYLGVFVRANKNQVRAFQGPELEDRDWKKAFAHYYNLLIARELARLGSWLQTKTTSRVSVETLSRTATDLAIDQALSFEGLSASISTGISKLQLWINNPLRVDRPLFSIAEAPISGLARSMKNENLLNGKTIYCCIDEYENLLDYQQVVLNTYVKHAEPPLSYKVGVRQNGHRTRDTDGGDDPLREPDDYLQIDIANEGFEAFAEEVAHLRLGRARESGIRIPESLDELLPALSLREEASLLDAKRVARRSRQAIEEEGLSEALPKETDDADLAFLEFYHTSTGTPRLELLNEFTSQQQSWKNRFNNYFYASLFWLSRGRKGSRIRKYYTGKRVLLALAAGNIRYFLELIDTSLSEQLELTSLPDASDELFTVEPRSQTKAARIVGERRLNQLEGLATEGIDLKRLVLALGRLFFELARNPEGKAPEVTSFILSGPPNARDRLRGILDVGVSHLAFVSAPSTKQTSPAEARADEYRIHPIFCAFFEISHRRKRRISIDSLELLNAISDSPRKAIAGLLKKEDLPTPDDELPDQLLLFSDFFKAIES